MRTRRPLSITLVGLLFVAVGLVGLVRGTLGFLEATRAAGFDRREVTDYVYLVLSEIAALLGGAYVLRGKAWARWLLAAWMAFHIVLSALHSLEQLLVHVVLFSVLAYVLFRPAAAAFFIRRGPAQPAGG